MNEQEPEKQKNILQRVSLFGALAIAIGAACGIVAIAYMLYWNDPNRKYDLARPGEQDNQSLKIEDDEADTTSPVTEKAVDNKIEYLEKEIKALNEVSTFHPEDLSDQRIQIAPSDQPSL